MQRKGLGRKALPDPGLARKDIHRSAHGLLEPHGRLAGRSRERRAHVPSRREGLFGQEREYPHDGGGLARAGTARDDGERFHHRDRGREALEVGPAGRAAEHALEALAEEGGVVIRPRAGTHPGDRAGQGMLVFPVTIEVEPPLFVEDERAVIAGRANHGRFDERFDPAPGIVREKAGRIFRKSALRGGDDVEAYVAGGRSPCSPGMPRARAPGSPPRGGGKGDPRRPGRRR